MYGVKSLWGGGEGLGGNMEINYNVHDPFCNKLSGLKRGKYRKLELRNE